MATALLLIAALFPGYSAAASPSLMEIRLGPQIEPARAWEPTVRVTISGDRSVVGEWDEDATPNGNMIAGWITATGGIGCDFKTSTDGGKTWGAAFRAPGISAGGDPVIAPDRSQPGVVYIMCIGAKSGSDYNVIAKSTDDGVTWTNWDRGASWSPVSLDYAMLVARGGRLVQVFNEGAADTNTVYSTDDGMTWSSKKDVGSGWPNCIEEDKDNNLWIMSGNSGQQVNFYKSTDYGATWSTAKSAGATGGARLSCATDHLNGDLYAVTESTSAVTLFHSADAGTTWMRHTVHSGSGLGDDGDGSYASMAVDSSGNLHVGYLSTEGGSTNAYYSNSTDKGQTWSTPLKINDVALSACGSTCAHYGHGLAISGKRVCFGFVAVVSGSAQYRHTCNGEAGGGGGAQLARIDVTPNPGQVAAGMTLQFSAIGYDTKGNQTPITPTWSATGGSASAQGLYTPNGTPGMYEVQAKVGTIVGKATVEVVAGGLASIKVTPATASITADEVQQFAAAGEDANGNPVPVAPQWSVTAGAVDGSGLFTPNKIGTFTVTATDRSKSGTAQVTVTAGKAAVMAIAPLDPTVRADERLTFTATAKDAKGNDVTVSPSWSVTAGAASGAFSGAIYTPNKVGKYTVTATAGSLTATTSVTVTPGKLEQVSISPKTHTMLIGEKVRFSVNGSDLNGNRIDPLQVTWRATTAPGSITSSGEFTGERVGIGNVVAEGSDGEVKKSAQGTVTVKAPPDTGGGGGGGGGSNDTSGPGMFGFLTAWLFPLLLVIVVAAVIVAAAAAVSKRRKRNLQSQAQYWQGYGGDRQPLGATPGAPPEAPPGPSSGGPGSGPFPRPPPP